MVGTFDDAGIKTVLDTATANPGTLGSTCIVNA